MLNDSRIIQHAIATIPFLNARIQGLYRLGRASKGEFWKAFWIRGAMLAATAIALAAVNDDDDRYNDLPEWAKDSYFHIYLDNFFPKEALDAAGINASDWHIAIPKPFEIGVIFGTLPERIMRSISDLDDGKTTVDSIHRMFVDTFALDMPQFIKPIVEQAANRDFFRDMDIESYGDQKRPAQERFGPRTSEAAKALSETFVDIGLPISPKRIEHVVKGYLGTLGAHMISLADLVARPIRNAPPRPSWRLDEIPEIGTFFQEHPAKTTKFISLFYKKRGEIEKLANSMRDARQFGRVERMKEIQKEMPGVIGLNRFMGKASKQMSLMNKRMNMVSQARDITPDEKKARLTTLRTRKNALAKQVVNRIKQVEMKRKK